MVGHFPGCREVVRLFVRARIMRVFTESALVVTEQGLWEIWPLAECQRVNELAAA